MQWLIIIVLVIIWIISSVSKGVSSVSSSLKNQQLFDDEREKKYKDRNINSTKDLYERNKDIIEIFTLKVTANSQDNSYSYSRRYSYKNYFFENLTRDCINEIALAENKSTLKPNTEYLSSWILNAPQEWKALADKIEEIFKDKQKELQAEEEAIKTKRKAEDNERAEKERKIRLIQWEKEESIKEIERNIKRYASEFQKRKAERKDPTIFRKIRQKKEKGNVCIEDVSLILSPDLHSWTELEKELMSKPYKAKPFPLFSLENNSEYRPASVFVLNNEIVEFNKTLEDDVKQDGDVRSLFKRINEGYSKSTKEAVVERFNLVLSNVTLPPSIPQIWEIDFDTNEGIMIVEIKLPDVVHNQVFKEVELKKGKVKKVISIKEQRDMVPNIHPSIILKIAYEIFRNDYADIIKLLVVNGWVEFDDPTTGNKIRTYTASLATSKEQITQLKLSKLDPVSAFANLKGKSAGKLIDIIPVSPMMSLDKKDKRFIETKDVMGTLDTQTNLASMDWQDFENLIAELFQKEFSEEGTEIKLTQSSRDKGVDAIVFNPDPIRGGKYVIQAKRYTNTVDVSAVRDLVAVVAHEGASRGILVTTSTFGADAYAFVQNKPITLLDGAKLLGLLEKHGYKFRVNLAEARKQYVGANKY